MGRLNKGFIDFERSIDREPNPGLGMRVVPESSYDYKRAIDAKTRTTKARVVALVKFDRTSPRDDLLFNQTDRLKNVLLDNTRGERELEMKARKEANKNYPSMFSP